MFKCPSCDGAIEFDANLQQMRCPYCNTEISLADLQAYTAAVQEQPEDSMEWDSQAGQQWEPGETEGLRIYTCNTCSGEIVCDETTGATECPFCGNPVVMTGQFAGDLKPDLVIPFQLDKKAAIAALQKHYKGKVLLPKVFKSENRLKEIKGVYVPFWLFDATAQGMVQYKATRTRVWSDSRYHYTETSHYRVVRGGSLGFSSVPVDGSSKMNDTLMESIEPYDFSKAVDFRTAYLSGFLADRYDVDADTGVTRVNQRIRNSTEQAFRDTVHGYTTVLPVSSNINLQQGTARYALLPVWLMNTKWNGEMYTFAVNGQTGKIVGDLPMDMGLFWKWFLGLIAGIAALTVGIAYLSWLF
ncbi:MAG: IBR domain-containing protein [Oscillospiraceae bacterium]|nr:IBR domain-containing protein [Oscillospiraceae bacterium]